MLFGNYTAKGVNMRKYLGFLAALGFLGPISAALGAGSVTVNDPTNPGYVACVTSTGYLCVTNSGGPSETVKIDQTTPGTTNGVQVNAALPAGSNIIGNFRVDQTTPGTTNGVVVNSSALPAGAATSANQPSNSAQGATTSGQTGTLGMMATTTSPPTDTNAQTNAMRGDTHGALRAVIQDTNGNVADFTTAVGTYPAPQSASTAGIATVASTSVESGHILKASAGMLYDIQITTGASAGNLMIFNSTTVPGDGAVTPIRCISVGANSTLDMGMGGDPPSYFSTGISVAFSTAAGSAACLTKTASSTAFFSWKIQ